MSPAELLAAAQIECVRQGQFELALQGTSGSMALAARWSRVVDASQRGERPDRDGAALLISLVARDAILDAVDLHEAAMRGQLWTDRVAAYLEWIRPTEEWRDRRKLSSHTVALFLRRPAIGPTEFAEACHWAARKIAVDATTLTFASVLAAATAWWVDRVPPGLAIHITGLQRYQVLTRETHARRAASVLVSGPSCAAHAEANRIAHWTEGAHGASDRLRSVIQIGAIVRDAGARHPSDNAFRRTVMDQLLDLMPQACEDGRAQATLVAATFSLIAEGGALGRPLGWRTITGYCQAALPALGRALVALKRDPIDLESHEWRRLYRSVYESLSGQSQVKAAAYISAFHRFILARGGAMAVLPSTRGDFEVPPQARCVWPHEVEQAATWIEQNVAEEDLRRQAVTALRLMATRPCRPGELATVRVGDVSDTGGGVALSIAPRANDGVGKSLAMRHRQVVDDRATVVALLDLQHHRRRQHADDRDHLFGAPYSKGTPWRWPETLTVVAQALRMSSGDPTLSCYALRHAAVSQAFAAAWSPGRAVDDYQPLAQASALAGHAGTTSSRPYIHLVEEPLAAWARRLVPDVVHCDLAGATHVADGLKKREPDGGEALGDASGRSTGKNTAVRPSLTAALSALRDHAGGLNTADISYRTGLQRDVVSAIVQAAGETLRASRLVKAGALRNPDLMAHAIRLYEPWWHAANEPKWRKAAGLVESIDTNHREAVVRSFVECARPRSISLDLPDAAAPLIEFLIAAVNGSAAALVIRDCGGPPDSRISEWVARGARLEQGAPRRGEPRVRLLVSSPQTKPGTRGRGSSVHGLYGLLVAAAACWSVANRRADHD